MQGTWGNGGGAPDNLLEIIVAMVLVPTLITTMLADHVLLTGFHMKQFLKKQGLFVAIAGNMLLIPVYLYLIPVWLWCKIGRFVLGIFQWDCWLKHHDSWLKEEYSQE